MERRLARLESRKPRGDHWRDPFDAAMALWSELQAVVSGRASWIPVYGPDPAPSPAFELAMREADRMAERIAAKPAA